MTLTRSTDHETALAAGFDIVHTGYWVRPDSAEVRREPMNSNPRAIVHRYIARTNGDRGVFYTMAEAVAWIGPVRP